MCAPAGRIAATTQISALVPASRMLLLGTGSKLPLFPHPDLLLQDICQLLSGQPLLCQMVQPVPSTSASTSDALGGHNSYPGPCSLWVSMTNFTVQLPGSPRSR